MQESYAIRWSRKERDLGLEAEGLRMIACGSALLPSSAAPFLSFDDAEHPKPIFEVFGSPLDWSSEERERVSPYLVLGSDGSGSPICIEQPTGRILLLDHEDDFRTLTFVNSSLTCLAESLLAYFGETDAAAFILAVQQIDPPAVGDGTFWAEQARMLCDA